MGWDCRMHENYFSKSMRIVIATGIFPPDIGGPATYSKLLAEELIKHGHKITIVTYGEHESRIRNYESGGQNKNLQIVFRSLPKSIRHLLYFWKILRYGYNADVIYAQDAVSAGFPAMVAAWILGKRFFLKVVGDHAWEQGMQRFGVSDLLDDFLAKKYGIRIALLRFFQMRTAKRAEKIVVPSTYLKSVVERWGISSERIMVIPNAISLPNIIPTKEEARRMLGLDGFVLVTIGRLVPWKGFQMLVELMPKLCEVIPNVKLVIIGSGPEERNLQLTTYNLQLPVTFTGAIPKEKLLQYLAAADVFLLNTSYEGFSHQLIEAMAIGVPVITTHAGGNKELVRDGENALVAEYNNPESWKDGILRLYGDEALRQKFQECNADSIKKYSAEEMVSKIESLFHNS